VDVFDSDFNDTEDESSDDGGNEKLVTKATKKAQTAERATTNRYVHKLVTMRLKVVRR
jgi:hypothetical protein